MTKVGRLFRENMIGRVKEGISKRGNVFLISYSKVSSTQMDDLRKSLRRAGAKLYVSKNTIAQLALKDLQFDKLAEEIHGQMAFVWSDADSVEISKTLTKFAKTCEGVLIQGGLLQGRVLEKTDVQRLSDLPSRQVLLMTLLQSIQSPPARLVGALNGKTVELVLLLKQLSEKKGR